MFALSDTEVELDEAAVDTRRRSRARVFVPVDLETDDGLWTGLTLDISEGGLFIATHRLLKVGAIVLMRLTLPTDPEPIVAAAAVRWVRPRREGDETPPGFGLQFVAMDARASVRIRAFMRSTRAPFALDRCEC